MKKLFFGLTLLALFLTNVLVSQCKIEITQEKIENYLLLKVKHHDSLTIKEMGWSNGKSERSIIIKENGTYCVKVAFSNGCISDKCIDIKSFSNPSCKVAIVRNSDASGKVKLCINNRDIKKIEWSSGESSECVIPIRSGDYCVKVVYNNGCEAKACINYVSPSDDRCKLEIIRRIDQENNKTYLCASSNQSIAKIIWSTGDSSNCIIPQKSGEYCVKIVTKEGCETKACINYVSPSDDRCKLEIIRRIDQENNKTYLCASSNQSIASVIWSTGDSSNCIIPQKSGEYCVKIVTKEGCETKACLNYVSPIDDRCKLEIIRRIDQDNKTYLCVSSNQSIASVIWSTGDSSNCIIPQKSGEYCVKIVTKEGCETKACINYIPALNSDSCKIQIIRIPNNTNNSYSLCVSSNNAIKSIEWSTGSKERCVIPEKGVEYCVKVEFTNGCIAKECIKIEDGTNNSCKIEIIRKTDEVTKKTYLCVVSKSVLKKILWSSGEEVDCILPVKAGEHCVKVVTAEGCELRACVKYEVPPTTPNCKLEIVRAPNPVSSGQPLLCVSVSEGVKSVEWSTGSNERCILGDKPGEYCVKVVFTNGCEAKQCIKVGGNEGCKVEIVRKKDNESINLCVSSNKKIKSFLWSNNETSSCIKPDSSGEYCVKIITEDGCETRTCINYDNNTGVDPNLCKIAVTRTKRGNQLYLCAETNHPSNDHLIVWSNGAKGKCIEIKETGRYCAQISVNGCEARACVSLMNDSDLLPSIDNDLQNKEDDLNLVSEENDILKITRFGPNPINEHMFIDIHSQMEHTAKLMIFDLRGNHISTKTLSLLKGENTVELNAQTLDKGVYYVKVLNANQSETVKMVKAF
jgi:trimeric autotransporter adhesin